MFGATSLAFAYIQGLDEEVGSAGIVYDNEVATWEVLEWEEEYGLTLSPIRVNPQIGALSTVKTRFQIGDMGLSIGGFSANAADEVAGSVPGMNYQQQWDEEEYSDRFSRGIVYLWNEDFSSVWLEKENGKYTFYPEKGTTTYSASRDFSLSTAYVHLDAPINSHFRIIGGFRRGKVKMKDSQTVSGIFHDQYRYYWNFCDCYYEEKETYENRYNLSAISEVKLDARGPELGIAGEYPLTERVTIGGFFTKGWLTGEVRETGTFTDIDKGFYERGYQFNCWDWSTGYSWRDEWEITGEIPLSHTYSASMEVTEIGFGLSYAFTPKFRVGLNYVRTSWSGVPKAARFHYHNGEKGPNPYWESGRTTDVSMDGWQIVFNFSNL